MADLTGGRACGGPMWESPGPMLWAGHFPQHLGPEAHYHFTERLPWIEVTDSLPHYPGWADTTFSIPQENR